MQKKSQKKAVVLICDASKIGVFGLCINGELNKEQTRKLHHNIFDGGDDNVLFAIHSLEEDIENDNLLLCYENFGITQVNKHNINTLMQYEKCRLVCGYHFWTLSRFKTELKQLKWVVGLADENMIFEEENDKKWQKALELNDIKMNNMCYVSVSI